ncbi:2-keto-4-pentenoate hydratase/2-oxohepta-3-ene-1,7-dioic acid hydratase (catechol pathway) [Roseivivax lentus]|uniref:2-keto-4-pentenoate hydratase/2-oxohepta-3-ene-1,7-dioic acid hydratase (Catechol pathway) n=1 Tax=Roseivivax lentus TaxID=633194 RepID=A0A1N7NVW3_9RHOB|nr:fumarylacetoacetate hydrolase family protein [Roseivivax lentus]SIT02359.1 2-keto-4-pentenoate hydratase/2-oxohepta-3-ene-1,7-dioic acid hydratase (catechol pathway) [Roseivivax lentus]
MKFVRFGAPGAETPGLLDDTGTLRDLSGVIDDLAGDALGDLAQFGDRAATTLPPVPGTPRLGPCVGGTGKFLCIGLNYADHAAEGGWDLPGEPVMFMKATSAISGANDAIVIPRGAEKVDWEVELAIVIGRTAKYVSEEEAPAHIAGYCIANDVSERSFQLERGGQWTKGKSCDGFGPLGPWLVTPDELGDVQALDIWLDVNGERMQSGTTGTMIFNTHHIVSYLSQFLTLYPGDVIATGTPPGVGLGMKPPRFLKPGDVVEAGIAGLGLQRQEVVADG